MGWGAVVMLGAALGWWAPSWFAPSHAEIRHATAELVPPGATDRDLGELVGSPFVVGPFFAVATFRLPDSDSDDEIMAEHAQDLGWSVTDEDRDSADVTYTIERQQMNATIFVLLGRPVGDYDVNVQVQATEPERGLSALGGAAFAALLLSMAHVWRRRRRSGQTGTVR